MVILAIYAAGAAAIFFIGGYIVARTVGGAPEGSTLFVVRGDMEISADTISVDAGAVEWFTNHPERAAGFVAGANFVEQWDEYGFVSDPPNAAFAAGDGIVQLGTPVLRDGRLIFGYATVSGTVASGMHAGSALFIDAVPTAVNDQITDVVASNDCGGVYNYQPGSIDVTVVDQDGAPIKFATVVLFSAPGQVVSSVTTSDDGKVSFDQVYPSNVIAQGYYTVAASADAYTNKSTTTTVCSGQTDQVTLQLQVITEID
jgi:5-hydroxyisourate hydrolase-like protein (transthyretin family)